MGKWFAIGKIRNMQGRHTGYYCDIVTPQKNCLKMEELSSLICFYTFGSHLTLDIKSQMKKSWRTPTIEVGFKTTLRKGKERTKQTCEHYEAEKIFTIPNPAFRKRNYPYEESPIPSHQKRLLQRARWDLNPRSPAPKDH